MAIKYFIDLGAYLGDTVKEFYEKPATFGVVNPADYLVIAFEPTVQNPEWLKDYPQVLYSSEAVWTEDCEKDMFWDDQPTDQSATLIIEETPPGKPRRVKCVDFDRVLGELVADEIIVKMDIEGAEHPILEKLIKSGKIKKITRLYVEFHNYRHSDGEYRYACIKAKLAELNIAFEEWH